MKYAEFLESKMVAAEEYGFEVSSENLNPILMPHQRDIVTWCLKGGRRAIFASFGLGKTTMQLEIATQIVRQEEKPWKWKEKR